MDILCVFRQLIQGFWQCEASSDDNVGLFWTRLTYLNKY